MDTLKRILVVDDEEGLLDVLGHSLGKLDKKYQIVTARNGQEALTMARETQFDLIITDLRMPGMGGVELTEAIRDLSPRTQVIWLTAYDNRSARDEARRLAIYRFLTKPVNLAEIGHLAEGALATGPSQEGQGRHPPKRPEGLLQERLRQLQKDAEADCVLAVTTTGQLIGMTGPPADLDVTTLAVLMASSFRTDCEIIRLLGPESTLKVSSRESDNHSVYAYQVGPDSLLVIVFSSKTRQGDVSLYARRAVKEVKDILSDLAETGHLQSVMDASFASSWSSDPESPPSASPADDPPAAAESGTSATENPPD